MNAKKNLKTAVAYERFSSDNQRDESIEAQSRAIHEYAERNGITIIHEYVDRARSATSDDRPAFQEMIKDSASGKFDMSISRMHGLLDKHDRVYIYFTLDEVMECFHCAREKANKLTAELDARGMGLIETHRQGFGRANIIYVKDCTS